MPLELGVRDFGYVVSDLRVSWYPAASKRPFNKASREAVERSKLADNGPNIQRQDIIVQLAYVLISKESFLDGVKALVWKAEDKWNAVLDKPLMHQIRHFQKVASAPVLRVDHRINGEREYPFFIKELVAPRNGAHRAYDGLLVQHQAVIGIAPGRIEKFALERVPCHVLIENAKEQVTHLFSLGLQELVCCFQDNLRLDLTRRTVFTAGSLYQRAG
jgi:hypothetical protein